MKTQRIAIYCVDGNKGLKIIEEALTRGHFVTAVVTNASGFMKAHPNLTIVEGKIIDRNAIRNNVAGHDLVICAYEITPEQSQNHVLIVRSIIEGIQLTEVNRFAAIGHVLDLQAEDTQEVHAAWQSIIDAQRKVLEILKNTRQIDWYYTHNIDLEPAAGTSSLNSMLITNSRGESKKPIKKDYVAFMDEIEIDEYTWAVNGLDI